MKNLNRMPLSATHHLFHCLFGLLLLIALPANAFSFQFVDDGGNTIEITKPPARVVSLVPSITEILHKIGEGHAIKAVTYHDVYPVENADKRIVGGYFSPSLDVIAAEKPDMIFISDLHQGVKEHFKNDSCRLVELKTKSINDSREKILLLGKIFNKEKQAQTLVQSINEQLQTIAQKVERIPSEKRQRVIRLMGRDTVMTPGDGSFQNEMIRAAGGIPPQLGRKGAVTPISKEEWIKFNPQVIYGCGGDRKTAEAFFNRPGWKDVDAVKNGRIFYFPCELTCRAATHTGYFVSWLSARIYSNLFSKKEFQLSDGKILKTKKLDLPLSYVKDAKIVYSTINDFVNKTLMLDFTKPLRIVSTLEGERTGIQTVGNHYSPPPCWAIEHQKGLAQSRELVYSVIGVSAHTSSFLFTGADMDQIAVVHQQFKDMTVYALVTAGVRSNALRMGQDEGKYYEPGTINIILLSNMKLTPRAMTRAIISATEAKTAALMDLDVRSTVAPRRYQATGTGTDNILVVQGTGIPIKNAGGHSKMGELIARAVYQGVQEAVSKQNALVAGRNIFQRLYDRHISLYELVSEAQCDCMAKKGQATIDLEEILMDPRYAGFVQASFTLSDAYRRELISDLSSYQFWCKTVAEEIAGRKIPKFRDLVTEDIPVPLKMSLNALLNGISFRAVSH
ncbi:MAG: ABC transporter substrate-binding protein [Deltaproteobacteria bacterium]|nr:ABC transporter substrate-binding protein [Deltaproteobacteria bacterium]